MSRVPRFRSEKTTEEAMPIQFPPQQRTILLCDYARGGFQPPEMVKRRPALVISPRLPHRDNLVAVVPMSGSPPRPEVPYVVRLELPEPLPEPFAETIWWVKADMIATVGFQRLDLFRLGRGPEGRRRYITPRLSPEAFAAVRVGVLQGLGIGPRLTARGGCPHVE